MFKFIFALVSVLFDGSDVIAKVFSLLGNDSKVKDVPMSTKVALSSSTFLDYIKSVRLAMVSYVSGMPGKRVRPQVLTYIKKILSEDKGIIKVENLSLIESTLIGMALNVSTILTFLEATNQMLKSTNFIEANGKLRPVSDNADQFNGLKDLYETVDDLYDAVKKFNVGGSTATLNEKFKNAGFLKQLTSYREDENEKDNTRVERSSMIDGILTSLISFSAINILDLFITLIATERGVVRFPEGGQNSKSNLLELFGSLFVATYKEDLLTEGMPKDVAEQLVSLMSLLISGTQIDGAGKIMIDSFMTDSLNIGVPAILDAINVSINIRQVSEDTILSEGDDTLIIARDTIEEDDGNVQATTFITPFQYGPSVELNGKLFNGTSSFEAVFNGSILGGLVSNFPTEVGKILSYDSFNIV